MTIKTPAKIKITHVREEGYAFASNLDDGGTDIMVSQHLVSGYDLKEGDTLVAHLYKDDGHHRARATSIAVNDAGDVVLLRAADTGYVTARDLQPAWAASLSQTEDTEEMEERPKPSSHPADIHQTGPVDSSAEWDWIDQLRDPPALDKASHRASYPAVPPSDEVPGHRELLDSLRDIRNHAMRSANRADVTIRDLINKNGRPKGWHYTMLNVHDGALRHRQGALDDQG